VHLKQNLVLLLSLTVFDSTAAWATDIQCASTQQPAERVICDHAILNNQYDEIFDQQQAMMSAGKLAPSQIAAWRQARNACIDVHCIDVVFAQWNAMAKSAAAVAPPPAAAVMPPDMASSPEAPPAAPASDAMFSASAATATSEASLVQQGSAAGIALPKPVDPQASAPSAQALAASAASAASDTASATQSRRTSGMSVALMLVLLFAVLSGVIFKRRSRGGDSSGKR
jgi:hypothetical protein